MPLPLLLLFILFSLASAWAQRSTTADLEQASQEVTLTPNGGELIEGTALCLSFPRPMISPDAVGRSDTQDSPFVFDPPLPGNLRWDTPSLACFHVTAPLQPGLTYTLTLRPGLTDLEGQPVIAAPWQPATFHSPPLHVSSEFTHLGKALPASPEVDLATNYPVTPQTIAAGTYFQDRLSRQRYPVDVILPEIHTPTAENPQEVPDTVTAFHVKPATPLPIDGTYDLVVESLSDAATHTPTPGIKAVPLGSTQALEITEVLLHTHPLDPLAVILLTSGPVRAQTLTAASLTIDPPVPNLTFFADDASIHLQGDFHTATTYSITLGSEVESLTGYPLKNPGPHQAAFHGLEPALIFPQSEFYQRSRLGLNVTMLQANCPSVTWQLAEVPLEKLPLIRRRLKEFHQEKQNPFSGQDEGPRTTELLVPALELTPIAHGTLDGSALHEARYQPLRWQPDPSSLPGGAYLLEASTSLPDGRTLGNRSLVFFNELVLHRKLTTDTFTLRVLSMENAQPVPDSQVEIIDGDHVLLAHGVTDAEGRYRVSRTLTEPQEASGAAYVVVRSPGGQAIQPYLGARFMSSGWASNAPTTPATDSIAAAAFTDRNLYRPGDPVHVKGTFRRRNLSDPGALPALSIPQDAPVTWSIHKDYDGAALASGESTLDAYGGWETQWTPPAGASLGYYQLRYGLQGEPEAGSVGFQVEEYKPPLFQVNLEVADDSSPAPTIRVSSHYFHGSPHAGALVRWEAHWSPNAWLDEGFQESDHHSPNQREAQPALFRQGELRLEVDGTALVNLDIPYEKPLACGSYHLSFTAEVTSPEGEVIHAVADQPVRPHPLFASIRWGRASEEEPPATPREETSANPAPEDLLVHLRATDRQGDLRNDVPMQLTIFREEMQTVKERVAPNVYRYRNFPRFHKIETRQVHSDATERFTPTETGHYIAYAELTDIPSAPGVSDRIHSLGDDEGRYEVFNDGEIALLLDRDRYVAGRDTAEIALESPFGGQAVVSLETENVVDQFLVDLPANNHPIRLPIKPEYHPNVHASVYLLRPGGADSLPAERFGTVNIDVDRPELQLTVLPELTLSDVEPGAPVNGLVRVLSQGQPVPEADLTVFAVDEAVHRLGGWMLPDWSRDLYPFRYLGVASFRGLDEHFQAFEDREVTEKGFLIGGGGADESAGLGLRSALRKDFRPLAHWQTQLRTDANGEAAFTFNAPDNLTAFTVAAVGQTKEHQFGQGETTFTVSKRLMVEPALTRFVRKGDTLELRAVLRQNYVDNAAVTVRCQVDGEIEWLESLQEAQVGLTQGLPQVVKFPCRILGGEAITVRFQAQSDTDPSLEDAVEVSLPVIPAGILQHTGYAGVVAPGQETLDLPATLPDHWPASQGQWQLTLSQTPYLSELRSLPEILDYPHGCLEQQSSRYLAYALMAGLLDYLPVAGQRHADYQQRLQEGLEFLQNALLPDGSLPYWQGETAPNEWVTLMGFWLAAEAANQGIPASAPLHSQLTKAHSRILQGRQSTTLPNRTLQTFALFVHSETSGDVSGKEGILTDLYRRRGDLEPDALTFLLLAMKAYGTMDAEQKLLAQALFEREIEPSDDTTFTPVTFGSPQRDRFLHWLARLRLASPQEKHPLSLAYLKESEQNGEAVLSTQENLWKCLLLNELLALTPSQEAVPAEGVQPPAEATSANGVSLAWNARPLETLQGFQLDLGAPTTTERFFIAEADVLRTRQSAPQSEDRGFRLERLVENLTDSQRTGSADHPFAIGDEVLLTYRFRVTRDHHYVALTDALPAGIQPVNFNLPQIAAIYRLPEKISPTLYLDHSELRDQAAHLYFNRVPAGDHVYAILARVTAAGTFEWPAAAIGAMYQPHVGGLTEPRLAHSRG